MQGCKEQIKHDHKHHKGCGHRLIQHGDHQDYLHDGHLCHNHDDHFDDHAIEISDANPESCADARCADTTQHKEKGHVLIPHGSHTDYLVAGRLHHVHGDHCDDHGPVSVVTHSIKEAEANLSHHTG